MNAEEFFKKYLFIDDDWEIGDDDTVILNKAIKLAEAYHKHKVESVTNEMIKQHIDSLPYYGTCTHEYNEGFEECAKWLKQKLLQND